MIVYALIVPKPRTGSNFRSVATHWVQVGYGGCWKYPQLWQRCNSRMPRLAASQNGFVHSFGTGIGRVTLLQSLIGGIILSPLSGSRETFEGRMPWRSKPLSRQPLCPPDPAK